MEPQLPTPYQSSERGPAQNRQQGESLPTPHVEQAPLPRPESAPMPSVERGPGGEQPQQGGGDPAWKAVQPQAAIVPQPVPAAPATAPAPAINDNPVTANDDDLIEKEWVEKAKKIVASTKNDPYRQEQEVSKLQADYLQKRYGKEIKLPSE